MNSDIPEWDMHVDSRGRVAFAHPGQAHAYLKRFADTDISAQFYEFRQKRSARQNRGFHACVTPWLSCEARGGWTIEALKLWVLGEVFGYDEFVLKGTGEVFRFPSKPHTSTLTVGEFCELIDRALELAAYDGVLLTAPDEYRRALEAVARKQARKAKVVA